MRAVLETIARREKSGKVLSWRFQTSGQDDCGIRTRFPGFARPLWCEAFSVIPKRASLALYGDQLARLVKAYAGPALCGDHDVFLKVQDIRRQTSDNLLRRWELERVRREVETAWREKDFARVVESYEPVKEYLSPAEMKKFEYAKKKVLSR